MLFQFRANVFGIFIISQRYELCMPKMIALGSFRKLNLSDQLRLKVNTFRHLRHVQAFSPAARPPVALRQVHRWIRATSSTYGPPIGSAPTRPAAAPSGVAEVATLDRDHLARKYDAGGEARKTAAPPISFGSAQRPSEVRRWSKAVIASFTTRSALASVAQKPWR